MRKILFVLSLVFLVSCNGGSSGGGSNGPSLGERLIGEWYASREVSGVLREYTLTIEDGHGIEEFKELSFHDVTAFTVESISASGEITLDYFEIPEKRTHLFTLFEDDQKLEICRNKNLSDCITFDRVK